MARYKTIDTNPKFLAVDLAQQLLPGTFEHALHHLLEHELDLTVFDQRFRNDATGAPAYPPAVLLKVILFGYSRGLVSSRAIERACREHITFIALCGDQAPHFTTIAAFIGALPREIAALFAQVLFICDAQGLIGRDQKIDALIADNGMRQRDERFAEQAKYKDQPDPLHDKTAKKTSHPYSPQDFRFDPHTKTCICPAGKRLYGAGSHCTINGYAVIKFRGAQRDCVPCTHHAPTGIDVCAHLRQRRRGRSPSSTAKRSTHLSRVPTA